MYYAAHIINYSDKCKHHGFYRHIISKFYLLYLSFFRKKINGQHINYTNKQFCNQSPKKIAVYLGS